MTTDTWTNGSRIYNAPPNSHLSATIDKSTDILKLFYSYVDETSGTQYLTNSYTKITDSNYGYRRGTFREIPTILFVN